MRAARSSLAFFSLSGGCVCFQFGFVCVFVCTLLWNSSPVPFVELLSRAFCGTPLPCLLWNPSPVPFVEPLSRAFCGTPLP